MYYLIIAGDNPAQLTDEVKEALEKLTEVMNIKPKEEIVTIKKRNGRPKKR
jgi:hypothetical protein